MNVGILGSSGVIGGVLIEGLKDKFSLTKVDIVGGDDTIKLDISTDYKKLTEVLKGLDVVIFLAWNKLEENFRNGKSWPNHKIMVENVLNATVKSGVKRLVLASSIHADTYKFWDTKLFGYMSPYRYPYSDSPYGATKVWMEMLAQRYAKAYKIEIICIRFGGIRSDERIICTEPHYGKIWLSHQDCISLVERCIEIDKIPNNFTVLYAVSDNIDRVHSLVNVLGWTPQAAG